MGALADAAGRPAGGSAAAAAAPGAACATDLSGCAHCGLPVAPALVEADAERQFCCAGCRTVWSVIHEHGLDRYYGLRDDSGARARPARVLGRSYAAFDDPAFLERYARPVPGGLYAIELYLEGVHCAACVWLVERVPRVVPGAVEVRLDIGRSRALATWDPAVVPLSRVAEALDALGYPPHPFRGVKARDMARQADRAMLIRIGVAGALAMNAMGIAFALYGGIRHGMEPEFAALFRWASLLIAIPAVLYPGGVFLRGAWAAIRTRTLHMDVPIAIGLVAAFAASAANTIRGTGSVYFESLTALVFLLLVGRFLQTRQQRGAADATELLSSLAPSTARRIEAGADGTPVVREVPLEALVPGARVEVRAGDTVPADGVVRAGHSELDLSLLTGESRPVGAGPGDAVHAGTVNLSGRLEVEVERAGEETRVGRLMQLVEEHARRRAPIVQLADRISGWFVVAVLVLAAVTGAIWWRIDPDRAVENVVALLIVTCPCALGLATPLAVSASIGRASRIGLLIKGADVIERLARPGRFWLDKTGTLTEGRVALVRTAGDPAALRLAAALEAHSAHPVARAFAGHASGDVAADRGPAAAGTPSLPRAEEVVETRGAGIAGLVAGRRVSVGSLAFLGAPLPAGPLADAVDAALADGLTPLVVSIDRAPAAVAALGDPLRADAPGALERLRAAGWEIGILSGDHPAVVGAVARRLAIAPGLAKGGVRPEEKLRVVAEEAAHGRVAMAGDGVNDAAALAAATVGIGVHGGAEAALAAADVYSARPGVAPLADLVDGARRTMGVIRRNLVFSLLYNLAGVGLAMAGLLDPIGAAILMPLSSLTVTVSSYRARTFDSAAPAREPRP
ncbi:MAG: heavy metal translocating P-type ATPase [Acidobacteria bacterium]|nr:heavy metal translocating P-type ATPase [Acidobacteriota bacterium]